MLSVLSDLPDATPTNRIQLAPEMELLALPSISFHCLHPWSSLQEN